MRSLISEVTRYTANAVNSLCPRGNRHMDTGTLQAPAEELATTRCKELQGGGGGGGGGGSGRRYQLKPGKKHV